MSNAALADTPAEIVDASAQWRDVYISAQDGLKLHARDYGARTGPHLPVVCLPGLTRNARDFHELAAFLATHRHRPRRVLSLDFRGRGGSAYDRSWKNYTPFTEMADVLDVLTAAGIEDACFVGTSRGGLVAMLLAAARPTALKAVILNDIGPVIDGRGLLRIKNVLSATRKPGSWAEATDMLKRAYETHFPAVDAAGWEVFARKTFADKDGKPAIDYDPKLTKTLQTIDFDQPMPTMWPQFDGLSGIPLMVLRGANSDILSEDTVARMAERRPDMENVQVDGAGHAPMLTETAILNRISAFITTAEDQRG